VVASGPPWRYPTFLLVPVYNRRIHTFHISGERGFRPAFGYDAPHPSTGGTSTLLINALLSTHHGRNLAKQLPLSFLAE
jgi:hypothetical protein